MSRPAPPTSTSSSSGGEVRVLLRGGGLRPRRCARRPEGAGDQQDRPRAARPRPGVRPLLPHRRARRDRRRPRHAPTRACSSRCTSSSSPASAARSPATRTPPSSGPSPIRWSGCGSRSRTPRSTTAASGPNPAGHRGPLRSRFVRAGATDADGTRFEPLDPTPLPEPGEGGPLVPLEVAAGTLVVLHGRLPHWSRTEPVGAVAPRLLGARDRGWRPVPRGQLAPTPPELALRGF